MDGGGGVLGLCEIEFQLWLGLPELEGLPGLGGGGGLGVLTCTRGGSWGAGKVGFVSLVGATWGEHCIECSMHICQVFSVCNNKGS